MYLILQQEHPEDFVLATGNTTTVREFVQKAFNQLQIEILFRGKEENEVGYVNKCNGKYQIEEGSIVVEVDPAYYRPTEVDLLIGDASKAKQKLGWTPSYSLDELVKEMVLNDIKINEVKS